MKLSHALFVAAFVALAPVAGAQDGHEHHEHGAASSGEQKDQVVEAFEAANDKMHGAMDVELTGDADVDFVRGMIPHHQGAIDMAKVVLRYGKDPQMRQLAQGVINAQEAEIASMKDWLTKHGK